MQAGALPTVVAAAIDELAVPTDAVTAIAAVEGAENGVFRVAVAGRGDIAVRASRPRHRSVDELRAEVAWVAALHEAGAPVAAPLAGPVALADGTLVVAFEWVPTTLDPATADVALFEAIGALVAEVHGAAARCAPPAGRCQWYELPNYDACRWLGGDDTVTRGAIAAIEESIAVDPGAATLVHGDLGWHNVTGSATSLRAIDFDDCSYASAGYDLASTIYDLAVDHEQTFAVPVPRRARAVLDGYASVAGDVPRHVARYWPALVVERAITARRIGAPDAGDLDALLREARLPRALEDLRAAV